MHHLSSYHLRIVAIVILLTLLGYLTGRLTTARLDIPQTQITFREDLRPTVSVVEIHGIQDGMLRGRIQGDVRAFIGDMQILPTGSGTFALVADDTLLTNVLSIRVPETARYVASRKGSKYYPVASKSGERIVLKNRVYFETSTEAEEAGYVR